LQCSLCARHLCVTDVAGCVVVVGSVVAGTAPVVPVVPGTTIGTAPGIVAIVASGKAVAFPGGVTGSNTEDTVVGLVPVVGTMVVVALVVAVVPVAGNCRIVELGGRSSEVTDGGTSA
jgi:hypothetical protein